MLAAAWYYGQTSDQITTPVSEKVENANMSESIKKTGVLNYAEASTVHSTSVTAPVVAPLDDVIHADLYFEVGRKGLTDEAKAQLATRAELLKQNVAYRVLIQG